MRVGNPLAFRPGPVTFWSAVIYLAVVIPLIYVHETVPPAPADDALARGLNLTEAWADLQSITSSYHPYNSHENDRVRDYFLERAKHILESHGVDYSLQTLGGDAHNDGSATSLSKHRARDAHPTGGAPVVTIFDDRLSNVTYTAKSTRGWAGQYFEGSNIYVYIHGKDDPQGNWWLSEQTSPKSRRTGGVLINCHFDSVSTGYGATDNGVACVSMLQLLSYFTTEDRQPNNGIVLLFNNAEEDGLLGARAFAYSPLLRFCHTFVNLEGAGAGGRAMLFRTTDLEMAKAYSGSPHPFGSVVAANAFERGVIKSYTDYSVFADVYGQRGLDIAFYAPRSRYHTQEDDARHTSVRSVWHMLSAALASTETLSRTTGSDFDGPRSDGRKDLVQNGRPTEGVWFDWFGDAWAAFPLRGLFAWSLTLLVATPLVLFLVTYLLIRSDKYYFFAREVQLDDESVGLKGWRGFVRYPLTLIFAAGLTVSSVFLLAKINPLIVYSSSYAVWAMTMSLFFFSFWLIARGASFVRPTALQRGFAIVWLYIITWVVQVFNAVAEDRMHIGALYFVVFFHTAVFVSLLITLLELFALPSKEDYAIQLEDSDGQSESMVRHGEQSGSGEDERREHGEAEGESDAESAHETTPLRGNESGYGASEGHTTFGNTYRRSVAAGSRLTHKSQGQAPHEREQSWADRLPNWTWLIQLLFLAPVHVIILGNLGLVQTTAMGMTGVDGSSLLTPLMAIGIVGILILLPLTPFIHRVTHHIPVFLLFVFIGTLIYNLVAFPFSVNNRFKFRFQQTVNLDEGTNVVQLSGLEQFVRPVMASLPTAGGKYIDCQKTDGDSLVDCRYDASTLPPDPANGKELERVVTVEAERSPDGRSARLQIHALNSRICYLDTSRPVYGFSVEGGGKRDDRFGTFPADGLQRLQIWRRTWDGAWNVTLQLSQDGFSRVEDGTALGDTTGPAREAGNGELKFRSVGAAANNSLEVSVSCAWDDANEAAKIPAFHEIIRFMPDWAVVTKQATGLVLVRRTVKFGA
ncbi:Putative zinc metalloprotease [Hirsutella minnesotensis 3608]|uniref:Peptide hydrolase n=1 Tax=Hirsutella minnesotensis 3608 TaxID=1043627 RepID=A0A0F8A6K4_9HYPO|nr:Putative zinc metalloprotease [Hirsutella minnesotensis 3608]